MNKLKFINEIADVLLREIEPDLKASLSALPLDELSPDYPLHLNTAKRQFEARQAQIVCDVLKEAERASGKKIDSKVFLAILRPKWQKMIHRLWDEVKGDRT